MDKKFIIANWKMQFVSSKAEKTAEEILFLLNVPKTLSALWNDIQKNRQAIELASTISFDWFVLALDFLYSINAINFSKGKVWRSE